MLCIQHPLSIPGIGSTESGLSVSDGPFSPKQTIDDHIRFVEEYAGDRVLVGIRSAILAFMEGYVYVDGYLQDMFDRVHSVVEKSIGMMLKAESLAPFLSDLRLSGILEESVEHYVLSRVHKKVTAACRQEFRQKDLKWLSRCERLTDITASRVGLPPEFDCDLEPAVERFSSLSKSQTPFEMLICLKETLDRIVLSVDSHIR